MKKFLAILFLLPVLALGFEAFTPIAQDACAARFGGGRSFGSRPAFNRSAPSPQRGAQSAQQQSGMNAAAPMTPRLGGFLGPLLAGGMLGALFFGGTFSGIGMADILVIGLIIFFVTRMLRRQVAARNMSSEGGTGGMEYGGANARSGAHDAWNSFRGNALSSGASSDAAFTGSGLNLPLNFDAEQFMQGAKLLYARMQESWDKRDLTDISGFTTPGMYRLIQEQAREDPHPSRTDVLTLNGQICGFSAEQNEESAAVYFDAILRERAGEGAESAREIWHFSRSSGGHWKLDGIQQVEEQ